MKLVGFAALAIGTMFVASAPVFAQKIEISINSRYLNFPVSHQQERGKMTFAVEGKPDLSVVIRLAPGEPDYWVCKDVSGLKGKTITINFDGNGQGISKIYQAKPITGHDSHYHEESRPQFTFTTRRA